MPTVGSGGISFSGINKALSCEMTSAYGTAPSVGTIAYREQPRVSRVGTLTLDCDGQRRTWRNCKIGAFQKQTDANQNGIVVAQILDRRWRWQRAKINGRYNIKLARGGYQSGTQKSPRELATLLFRAMGESGADVSALPDESRPAIDWDVSSAAEELASLCESLACRVTLGNDDVARIVRLGVGRALQDSPFAYALGDSLDTPDPPDEINLVGAEILHQCRLKLKAVGEDIGGVVRPIDNLSYKPSTGWEKENPATLGGVEDREVRQNDGSIVRQKQLALNSVYRWYQLAPDNHEITDKLTDVERKHIVIPAAELAEKYIDEQGIERKRAAYCAGVWTTATKPDGKNSRDDQPVVIYFPLTLNTENIGFSLDSDRWLVQFAEPVYKLTSGGNQVEPAEIYLVCAVIILDKETRGPIRYEKKRRIGSATGAAAEVETVRRDDVIKRIVSTYQTSGAIRSSDVLDEANLEQRADYYLDAQQRLYQSAVQQELKVKGIQAILVDGLVQQVTWTINTTVGVETWASQGYEANRNVPSYDEWRRRQKVAAETTKAKK